MPESKKPWGKNPATRVLGRSTNPLRHVNLMKSKVIIYQSKSGGIELKGDFQKDTLWASQAQIADIFGVERSVVTKHVRNILKDKVLNGRSVCANFAHTADFKKAL